MYNGRDGVITERDSSLIYMRARFYSPDLRRFINADLLHGDITNSLTLNRYAYCNGDPVNGIDPMGLSQERGDKPTILDKLRNVVSDIKNFSREVLESIFGYEETVSSTVIHKEKSLFSIMCPINLEYKFDEKAILYSYGDATKLLSTWVNIDQDNSIIDSSTGLRLNLYPILGEARLGLSDIGLYIGAVSGNSTSTLGLDIDLSMQKVYLDFSLTESNDNTETSTDLRLSADAGLVIAFLFYCLSGGSLDVTGYLLQKYTYSYAQYSYAH